MIIVLSLYNLHDDIEMFLLHTAPNTLFDWTKEKLPGALTKGLPCPKCGKMWDVDELIKTSKMSPDERLFLKSVEIIIKQNAELVK